MGTLGSNKSGELFLICTIAENSEVQHSATADTQNDYIKRLVGDESVEPLVEFPRVWISKYEYKININWTVNMF